VGNLEDGGPLPSDHRSTRSTATIQPVGFASAGGCQAGAQAECPQQRWHPLHPGSPSCSPSVSVSNTSVPRMSLHALGMQGTCSIAGIARQARAPSLAGFALAAVVTACVSSPMTSSPWSPQRSRAVSRAATALAVREARTGNGVVSGAAIAVLCLTGHPTYPLSIRAIRRKLPSCRAALARAQGRPTWPSRGAVVRGDLHHAVSIRLWFRPQHGRTG